MEPKAVNIAGLEGADVLCVAHAGDACIVKRDKVCCCRGRQWITLCCRAANMHGMHTPARRSSHDKPSRKAHTFQPPLSHILASFAPFLSFFFAFYTEPSARSCVLCPYLRQAKTRSSPLCRSTRARSVPHGPRSASAPFASWTRTPTPLQGSPLCCPWATIRPSRL